MASDFVHLHTHSLYSPMWGVPSIEALCEAVVAQGGDSVALTDRNGLYGAIHFLEIAKAAGLTPILGAEVVDAHSRAVLLARSTEGYANLCRILSARHGDEAFDLIATVADHRAGLVILSDHEVALTQWRHESPEDLYVELTPGQDLYGTLQFSRRAELPAVATTRAVCLKPDEYQAHRVLRAIATNRTLSRLSDQDCAAPAHRLMSPSEITRHIPDTSDASANTRRITDRCTGGWDFCGTIFPSFRRLSPTESFALLRQKTYAGAQRRYGVITPAAHTRLEQELTVIRDKGYADYFLIVDEIVQQAPRTCGRGSAAASIVSYCLNITHVDPLRHHLMFERFLNPGRHDPPDIDLDFPWDERPKILDWVFAHHGRARAAMVANQNTLAPRAALREVAKVYGMTAREIGRALLRLQRGTEMPDWDQEIAHQTWAAHTCRAAGLQEPWPEILSWALRLQGRFRNLGLHPGGVVLVPDEIRRYVPVERSASGLPVIQWEKDQAEAAGLVKIDLLGNRSLAVIRDALAAVARNTGRTIDYAAWDPLSDPATNDLIRKADTIGCFYVESPATRMLLTKLWRGMPPALQPRTDTFEYLVAVSSLIRPAALVYADDFVRRAQGLRYQPLHPLLGEVLDETHGVMVYQEDVVKVAVALAGFSLVEGDQLRKVLSKKHKRRRLRDYRAQFYAGATAGGVTDAVIEQAWAMIMSFAGYSFCKPHSASYAQVSFKSAYLRVHYPAEFIAAVAGNQGGYYSTYAYLSEGRRMGLDILPPDLNASAWTYEGCGRQVRMGFMQINGLHRDWMTSVLEERRIHGPYRSFADFMARIPRHIAQTRLLIQAGCFDVVAGELTRPALLWRLYARETDRPLGPLPIPPDYTERQKIEHETALFGFPLRCRPLDRYAEEIRRLAPIDASAMARYVGRNVTLVGLLVTEKVVAAKTGEAMEFMTLEDRTGLYDATIFPALYRRCGHLLAVHQAYVVSGRVESTLSALSLTVLELRLLAEPPGDDTAALFGAEPSDVRT